MEVKGTAFLGRRVMIEAEFGAERFEEALRQLAVRDPVFGRPILGTTRIPIDAFMRFNDHVLVAFYKGDPQAYFRVGVASAEWAFSQGPYKRNVADRNVDEFVPQAGNMYRNYFTEGEARGARAGKVVTLQIDGIRAPYRHVYFEYAICGDYGRGLEIVSGAPVKTTRVEGFSRGDARVLYEFRLA